MLQDEQEALNFLLEQEFGMEHQAFYVGFFSTWHKADKQYAPNGSNYHDHLCSCPGCNYDGPDPTEAEIQEMEKAMQESIRVPYEEIEATTWHVLPMDVPFCNDLACPCHCLEMMIAFIEQPLIEGLLTGIEALRLWRGKQV